MEEKPIQGASSQTPSPSTTVPWAPPENTLGNILDLLFKAFLFFILFWLAFKVFFNSSRL